MQIVFKSFIPGLPEGEAVLLACETHGGRINNRHELLNIRHEHTIEELLISILQIH